VSRVAWARLLLAQLGYAVSVGNLTGLVAWMLAEGGWWANSALYNPLNTTLRVPGSRPINSVGVQAYTSLSGGLAATVATLRNGYYPAILAAWARDLGAGGLASAVERSPWGTGAGVWLTITEAAQLVAADQGADVAAFTSDDDERRALIRLWWYTVHHGEIPLAAQTWCLARWNQTGSGDLTLAAVIDGTAPNS